MSSQTVQQSSYHVPVMLGEVLEHLVTTTSGLYVDGPLGGAGHAEKILEKIAPDGSLIGIDADADAIIEAGKKLFQFQQNIELVHDNTVNIASILRSRKITKISGLLLDLGVSSFQLDEASKGFSFRSNERLDMRMDKRQPLDAFTVVNMYDEQQLVEIFWKYGEEKFSRKIAKTIVAKREVKQIETTGDLAEIIEGIIKGPFGIKSLARVFQGIRIEVNDELNRLQTILRDSIQFLESGARVVVISYHSLEDRIVKQFFNECAATVIPSGNKFMPDTPRNPELIVITKKPMTASEDELRRNPRSRSAKMRVAEGS